LVRADDLPSAPGIDDRLLACSSAFRFLSAPRDGLQHVDPTVVAAERWIDAHLSNPISVTALASMTVLPMASISAVDPRGTNSQSSSTEMSSVERP
jgi:hypothetical protein